MRPRRRAVDLDAALKPANSRTRQRLLNLNAPSRGSGRSPPSRPPKAIKDRGPGVHGVRDGAQPRIRWAEHPRPWVRRTVRCLNSALGGRHRRDASAVAADRVALVAAATLPDALHPIPASSTTDDECYDLLAANEAVFWGYGQVSIRRAPARGAAGSGASAHASGGCPACGAEPPQLLLPVATGGPDQPVSDRLLPSRRDQLLINAELPSNQAQACSAGIIRTPRRPRAPAAAKLDPASDMSPRAQRRHHAGPALVAVGCLVCEEQPRLLREHFRIDACVFVCRFGVCSWRWRSSR